MRTRSFSRGMLTGLLLLTAGLIATADQVQFKDGRTLQGTVEYQDADIIKFKLAGTNDLQVFFTSDVAKVTIAGASAGHPRSVDSEELSEEDWDAKGFRDGTSSLGLKTALAGVGGCLFGTAGGCLLGPPTALTAGGESRGRNIGF